MRILIIHYNPAMGMQGAGGAESAIRDQEKSLADLGHEVVIRFSNPQRAYAEVQPDIVHFHTIHVGIGLQDSLGWAQRNEIPHCISLHDYWPFCGGRMLQKAEDSDRTCNALHDACDEKCRFTKRPASYQNLVNGSPTVTFNPHSADIFLRNGTRVDAVIPHGIDTDFFKPDPEARIPGKIVTSSAWANWPTKGMHILQDALKATKLDVTLVTGVPRRKVRDELQTASIYIFPSTYEETFGLCLAEAMACGCACIASAVAGARYQIGKGNGRGILVKPCDVGDLATTLGWLYENPNTQEAYGRKAREWAVENTNLERMGRDYEQFYGRLMR
jgi:glycosyltransferase involved in cell wall biosynthesis